MKKQKFIITFLLLTLIVVAAAFSPAPTTTAAVLPQTTETAASGNDVSTPVPTEVRTITWAIMDPNKPYGYVDENGKITGAEPEILRKVDELLPEYEFKFESMDQDAMLLGLESGRYPAASAGLFWTEGRAEKFLYSSVPIAYTKVTLLIREDEQNINSFSDVLDKKIAPTGANGGIVGIVYKWNQAHPDQIITLSYTTGQTYADLFRSVADGTYDTAIILVSLFDPINSELKLPLKLSPIVDLAGNWPIYNKSETVLAERVAEALTELQNNGVASQIAIEFYGEDIFAVKVGDNVANP